MASAVLHAGNKNKMQSNGSLSSSVAELMRRPFGVAAVDLTPIIKKPEDFKNNLDLPFILCEKENLDSTLKKLIMNKDVGKIDSKLAVSVELLHGDIKQVKNQQNLHHEIFTGGHLADCSINYCTIEANTLSVVSKCHKYCIFIFCLQSAAHAIGLYCFL